MKTVLLLIVLFITTSFVPVNKETFSVYKVQKLTAPPKIDAVWDKAPWKRIVAIPITNYMGDKPEHLPFTQAKMAYDNSAIYIIFRVEDQYIKAVHSKNQEMVCRDSCVEFFFTPDNKSNKGYFNLEMNCGGVFLFNFQKSAKSGRIYIADEDIEQIEVAHTLPKLIENEITEKTTWVVEYRIPFSVLKKYYNFSEPQNGTVWRANFYKCADRTSHPHWLTWAPVNSPRPNFHLPEYFGVIEFQ